MNKYSKQYSGLNPPHFAVEEYEGSAEVYTTGQMSISVPKVGVDLETGCRQHLDYQLIFALDSGLTVNLENLNIVVEPNEFLPINPGQYHEVTCDAKGSQVMIVSINKKFMHGLSYSIFRKDNVIFANNCVKCSKKIQKLIRLFKTEYKDKKLGYHLILQNITNYLALILLRQVNSDVFHQEEGCQKTEKTNISRVIEFLTEHYYDEFSLEHIAQMANLSPYHFIRVFKSETGKTPYVYLMDVKMERAKKMLRANDHSVTEICFLCGFSNLSHFSTVFKQKIGVSPKAYRKLLQSGKM